MLSSSPPSNSQLLPPHLLTQLSGWSTDQSNGSVLLLQLRLIDGMDQERPEERSRLPRASLGYSDDVTPAQRYGDGL